MTESYLSTLLQLRLLIGYLGERTNFAWWPTAFYEASSRFFLEPVFSKTAALAQYHGVLEAARRLHDEHLSVGSYHLFRLPEEVEQDLHLLVQHDDREVANQALKSRGEALEALDKISVTCITFNVGPMAIGTIKDIQSIDVLRTIAGAYSSAFSQNCQTYPYLVG